MEMDFDRIDINQCPKGKGNSGPNRFANTARCKTDTTEVHKYQYISKLYIHNMIKLIVDYSNTIHTFILYAYFVYFPRIFTLRFILYSASRYMVGASEEEDINVGADQVIGYQL